MSKEPQIRWGWLKFMYVYTIVTAGGFGDRIAIPLTYVFAKESDKR